ncbi:MAG TPA: flagellar biosynthetic protein FliO [Desulfocapsa sulfexigens]|nr:flagellar biosynthetic protein FliO [Desulfocapsa sulfexigens]
MLESTNPTLLSASLRMIWGLLIVSGVLLVIYGLMRKRLSFAKSNSKSRIQIREIRHLMPKKSLCLVEVGGKEFLLGLGTENISLIATLDTPEQNSFQENLTAATHNKQ